jgi:hypothetical protein
LQADLQRLFEALETLGGGRERQPEPDAFFLVPRRSDTEPGAALRQHVEGCHRLGQEAGFSIDHRGDPSEQFDAFGLGGEVAECGVRLEHFVLGRSDAPGLPDVVHHREFCEADVFGHLRRSSQVRRPALWGRPAK